jgi:hypothetical protein
MDLGLYVCSGVGHDADLHTRAQREGIIPRPLQDTRYIKAHKGEIASQTFRKEVYTDEEENIKREIHRYEERKKKK